MGEGNVALDQPQAEVVYVAKAESGLDDSLEFVSETTPQKQVLACYKTLKTLTDSDSGYLKNNEGVKKWLNIIEPILARSDDHCCEPDTAKFIVDVTVMIMDASIVDLMVRTDTEAPKGSKSFYYRDQRKIEYFEGVDWLQGVSDVHVMTKSESETLYKAIDPKNIVKTEEELLNHLQQSDPQETQNVYLGKTISTFDFNRIRNMLSQKDSNNTQITAYVPIRFGELVMIVEIKGSDVITIGDMNFRPISHLPLQDIWRQLLLRGYPVYDSNTTDISKDGSSDVIDTHNSKNALVSFLLDNKDEFHISDRLLRKHTMSLKSEKSKLHAATETERFYQNEFNCEKRIKSKPEAIITRSGVSANEVALLTAADEIYASQPEGREIGIYFQKGWYYENFSTRAIKSGRFVVSDSEEDSQIICINHDPSGPIQLEEQSFNDSKISLIRNTIHRANENPGKRYVIIYDKTSDLNFSITDIAGELPANLSLYETMSLSKHQRGDRNGFYGAVLHWGSASHDDLSLSRSRAMGEPTEYTISTFPHVNGGDIRRAIEHNRRLSEVIKDVFQSDLSMTRSEWQIEIYNYYAFVLPPLGRVLDNFIKARIVSKGLIEIDDVKKSFETIDYEDKNYLLSNEEFYKAFLEYMRDSIKTLYESHFTKNVEKSTIFFGDSFGLSNSQLVYFWNWKKSLYDKKVSVMGWPRFSFGSGTTEEEVHIFFEEIKKSFEREQEKIDALYDDKILEMNSK